MGFNSNLDGVLDALGQAEYDALYMIGKLIETEAAHLAPVGDIQGGSLRQSITSTVAKVGGRLAAVIGTNIEYALYVEKGTGIYAAGGKGRKTRWRYYDPKTDRYYWTRGMKPQPILETAAPTAAPHIVQIVKEVYGRLND